MKKVGILTFSYSCNGGSVMQAYALQKTISSFDDYEATIINYSKTRYDKPVIGKNVFVKSLKKWTPTNIIKWSAQIVSHPIRMRKYERFFAKYYNNYSKHFYSRDELFGLNDVYDKFVVGSDQVWNYGSPQVDDTYFLDFVRDNSKKISYAASFGQREVPEDKRQKAGILISKFSNISVRESDGVNIVSGLTSKEATWVLDPSLLLDKQDYQELSAAPKKKGYVYLYLRRSDKKLEKFAQTLAKAKGLEVVKVVYHWLYGKNGKPKGVLGPHDWLGYIENADYVITNSFHGICFSIIFEKEFYVDYLKAEHSATNSRIEGLIQQFGLSKRHIDDVSDVSSLDTIDYMRVNELKKQRKEESLAYLKAALDSKNQILNTTYFETENKGDCCGCGACMNICPCNAITMQKDEYGFAYPCVDREKCVDCGLCNKACAQVNNNHGGMPVKAFAGSHTDKDVLHKSSSGGVFYALAEHFISIGGAVCGCVWGNDMNAIHICAENESDIIKIRKSKYMQSDIGLVYRDIKARLKNGQPVLFTGTPCQVAALYSVIGKNNSNLATMDLICHGVPSSLAFNQFVGYLEKRHKTKIVAFDFRSKKFGWKRYSMEFTDENQRTINIGKAKEYYIPAFTGGNIVRESCLSCKYACPNRIGDITIGDFWGYEKLKLNCDTSYGTSAFTINRESAMKWLDILKEKLDWQEVDYGVIVRGNACLRHPAPTGKKREDYMQAIKDGEIDAVALKYRKTHKKKRIGEAVRHALPLPIFKIIRRISAK